MDSRLMLLLILLALPVLLEGSLLSQALKIIPSGIGVYKFAKNVHDSGNENPKESPSGFTVFFPTEEAFNKISNDTLESLTDEDIDRIFDAHVIPQFIASYYELTNGSLFPTLLSDVSLTIEFLHGHAYVSSTQSTGMILDYYDNKTAMIASYLIDAVLYVPTPTPAHAPEPGGAFIQDSSVWSLLASCLACVGLLV